MIDLRNIGVILGEPQKSTGEAASETTAYDLIIIGGGPAGMTATVYAARKKLKTLLISKDLGGQVRWTSDIENYMGYQYITGEELATKFQEQITQFPVALHMGDEVRELASQGAGFSVTTGQGKRFQGQTVIIASGKQPRSLNISGENRLIGRGVSYCATCDAPLFADRDVAVIGGGNSAFTAVADLLNIASKIYVVDYAYTWQADPVLLERAKRSVKMIGFLGYQVVDILGQHRVEAIVIRPRQGGEDQSLPVQGVFIEIGLVPNAEFARGLVQLNSLGEVIVDHRGQTNVPGVFGAGDVTTVPEKQIIIAAGEGAKAALSAYEYLLTKPDMEGM